MRSEKTTLATTNIPRKGSLKSLAGTRGAPYKGSSQPSSFIL
jgi:hypothetical protein